MCLDILCNTWHGHQQVYLDQIIFFCSIGVCKISPFLVCSYQRNLDVLFRVRIYLSLFCVGVICWEGTFRQSYGRHTNLDQFCVTYVEGFGDTWLGSSCFGYIVTGATCGAGNAHSFRNTWFHPLWEFMISPIRYIMYIYITEFVSFRTMFTD